MWRGTPGRREQGEGLGPTSVHTPPSADVDECLEQLDECHYNQICENTPGGHRCSCPRGYRIQSPGLPCLGTGTLSHRGSLGQTRLARRQGVFLTRVLLSSVTKAKAAGAAPMCPDPCFAAVWPRTSPPTRQGHLPWEPRRRGRVGRSGWVSERLSRENGPPRDAEEPWRLG